MVLTVLRCDCGGELQRGIESTEKGPRWYYACPWCGTWWRPQNGIFGPVDRQPILQGWFSPDELLLLACFRRLPGKVQSEVVSHVRSLADGGPCSRS